MTEQLEFVFSSSDWKLIIPHEHHKKYLLIESWCTEKEEDDFWAVECEGELKDTVRAAVFDKRMRLLETFQINGFMV